MTDRMQDQQWLDEEAGPVVPAYALTRGRVRPSSKDIDLVAIVTATGGPTPVSLGPEQWMILSLCARPASLADIAAAIDLPLGVVRVLVGDLHEQGLVQVRPPANVARFPTEKILGEVINGLRAL
ncbi:hypothetical protein GCM10010116_51320 [Microbispora rosea subsp. aerata]|nr:DUF742 domain-containing protein [Microbispora rosea]GGO25579.1 hypothetical protein GCM10010116_51320 [Microbispora rosea subsp. aerata]GIH56876.1 hypothetical protein Mro02_37900 [Microbispora rosea subsp. aerata]GLJ82802.1 hypothetical protein GCM10017588_15280 [Microbispora rosea subsp. aerata]